MQSKPRASKGAYDSPIASRRLSAGLTQEQVAQHLSVHPSTVRRWESGEVMPRKQALLALAQLLRCTPGDLL